MLTVIDLGVLLGDEYRCNVDAGALTDGLLYLEPRDDAPNDWQARVCEFIEGCFGAVEWQVRRDYRMAPGGSQYTETVHATLRRRGDTLRVVLAETRVWHDSPDRGQA